MGEGGKKKLGEIWLVFLAALWDGLAKFQEQMDFPSNS